MRAYFFQNFYLQGIHAGIQSQHTTAEMFVKYQHACPEREMLYDWAINHKTAVVLNGGMQKDLFEVISSLNTLPYPFAWFKEEQDALNMALTNVGVILPAKIYDAPKVEGHKWWDYLEKYYLTNNDVEFIRLLQSKRLMN
ncbi:hypothetical protein Barba31A_gp062 [Rheinheimera phage vB_RspM_Barba31A]|uniref:Uncharacterized protein n=1 Tax=Rheinheimera phage vB_RspM_Barba31A TaxID=2565682 RepID=A0A4P8NDW6_9CAUD|nr:hypothetical protein Barba31A_gp062 [Rheinheimera phage vB_RspM_Barba31A]